MYTVSNLSTHRLYRDGVHLFASGKRFDYRKFTLNACQVLYRNTLLYSLAKCYIWSDAVITAMPLSLSKLKKRAPEEVTVKPKKKIDRFDGLTEEEVQKYTLSDYLEPDLDMVFVGINPSLMAAHRGRYYAGPGNHFYKLLHESGLVPKFVSFEEDYKLLKYKIGLTNIVHRATRSSADLKRTEIKEGASVVEEKLKIFKPKIAIFNGKGIYEVFANKNSKSAFNFGLQPERIENTAIWVVPSSSARCANFPRMKDKLHFYVALKKYLLFLKGEINDVDAKEFFFEGKCKQFIPSTSKMWRRKNMSAFLYGGRVANKDTVNLDTSEECIATVQSTEFIVKELGNGSENSLENLRNKNESLEKCLATAVKATFTLEHETKKVKINDENSTTEKLMTWNFKEDAPTNHLPYSDDKETYKRLGKRSKKLSPKLMRPPKQPHIRREQDSADFVNLIKQRLSEKKFLDANTIKTSKENVNIIVPCRVNGKKLKHVNINSNELTAEDILASNDSKNRNFEDS
ncbi:uncharacterized protein LOC107269758 [Cephus cinctus]|uniref:G/T mismatch-specific thymine DNA glycosylase n=1 Tax=Cephus cinctus TaxID=211228 RepID=A0AAJ7FMR5_CEPCN|nr:uncharacterized protein LOC107269758 [Cephus cinctus]